MRAREFIVEAKPENLGQGMLDKMYAAWLYRDANEMGADEFTTGTHVAEKIYKSVGPKFLIWASKQYVNDAQFKIAPMEESLEELKGLLTHFATLITDKRVQIEKDINKYASIGQLRDTIEKATISNQELGSTWYSTAINGLNPFVESGQADWLYKGSDYAIYHPKTFESSNILSKNLIGSVNICTVMGHSHFDSYSRSGTLFYIFSQSKMYNCFISKDESVKKSEYAGQDNVHNIDLPWLLGNFPKLKDIIPNYVTKDTEFTILATCGVVDGQEIIRFLGTDPYTLNEFAKTINRRIPEAEQIIAQQPGLAFDYAKHVIKGRFPAGEPAIAKSTFCDEYDRLFDTDIGRDTRVDDVSSDELDKMADFYNKKLAETNDISILSKIPLALRTDPKYAGYAILDIQKGRAKFDSWWNDMDEEEQSDYMDDEAQVDEFEYSLEPYDGQTVKIRKFNYSGNEYRIVIEAGGNFTTFHDSGQHLPAYLTDIHF